MTKLPEAINQKHVPWLHYLRRSLIESGEMSQMVEDGLRGLTLDLAVTARTINSSADYNRVLDSLIAEGTPFDKLPRALLVDDIQRAATILNPIYEQSQRLDGFISIPIDPALAHDTVGTVAAVRHLLAEINYPNVMVEIPATTAGIAAIKVLTADGVCTNATLVFSLAAYEAVANAYIAGLTEYMETHSVWRRWPASVVSIRVGAVDNLVDDWLAQHHMPDWQRETGLALARLIYDAYRTILGSDRWQMLAKKGGLPQRPLWCELVPPDFQYADTHYLAALALPGSVSSLEPVLWHVFCESKPDSAPFTWDGAAARTQFNTLLELGFDLAGAAEQLQADGLARLATNFQNLRQSVRQKREQLEDHWQPLVLDLAHEATAVSPPLTRLCDERVLCRIWNHDHTVWQPEPAEVSDRLAWLHLIPTMRRQIKRLESLTRTLIIEGYTHVFLLGMGGSGLAPQLFTDTFTQAALPPRPGLASLPHLQMQVLANTDPAAIAAQTRGIDLTRTLFIVISKSGRTVETMALFKYFYNKVLDAVGVKQAGHHFMAVTDPASPLAALAQELKFRQTFFNPTRMTGRFGALAFTGLLPAALAGVDLTALLERAEAMACNAHGCNCAQDGDNVAGLLGTVLAVLAGNGRDKLTFITSPALAGFADWVEQLLAESLGKDGQGIVPVVGEPVGPPAVYGADRAFVYLRLAGDPVQDTAVQTLKDAGFPVLTLHWRDLMDVGGQFFLWQMATAVAAHHLRVNPFSQPHVDRNKAQTWKLVQQVMQNGELFMPDDDVFAATPEVLQEFLAQAQKNDYIALQVFAPRSGTITQAVQDLRLELRDRTRLATMVGYGPRCLHTTGQMLLDDGGRGLVIQLLANVILDVLIPDKAGDEAASLTFGTLKELQALEAAQALRLARRRVLRLHLGADAADGLRRLSMASTTVVL